MGQKPVVNKRQVARWRTQPRETGLASTFQGPRGFDLRIGEQVIICVRPLGTKGWYWHTRGDFLPFRNTSYITGQTKEQAKAEAHAYYQRIMAERKSEEKRQNQLAHEKAPPSEPDEACTGQSRGG